MRHAGHLVHTTKMQFRVDQGNDVKLAVLDSKVARASAILHVRARASHGRTRPQGAAV